jgi:hypothetical protein
MKNYKISNDAGSVLDRLVREGVYRTPEAALNAAVTNYLARQIPLSVKIDPTAADNGAARVQDQWILFFNRQGKLMISAANIYEAGKSASDDVLKSLRDDLISSLIVTSTRIGYSLDDLSGRITQNYGSTIIHPTFRDVKIIPVYQDTPLLEVLNVRKNRDGLKYLQALFVTNDGPKEITDTLEHLSDKKAADIGLWTPDQASRRAYSQRAVRFNIDGDWFLVLGFNPPGDYSGRSRGVSVSPRSGRAKK